MQIHTPGAYPRQDGDFDVRLHPGAKNDPFAIIELSEDRETRIFVESPEDADRLIKAAAAAKELILGARALLAPVPDEDATAILARAIATRTPLIVEDDQLCPAFTEVDGETVFCDREPGHPGSHHGPGPDEGSEVAWSDQDVPGPEEYDPDDLETCPASRDMPGEGTVWCTLRPGHYPGSTHQAGPLDWSDEPQGCRS